MLLTTPISRPNNAFASPAATKTRVERLHQKTLFRGPELLQPPAGDRFLRSPMATSSRAIIPAQTQLLRSPLGYPITLYTLRNGHRLLIEQRPSDVVGLRTYVNAGSVLEDGLVQSPRYPNRGLPPGTAHLNEHRHFLSTQHFPEPNQWSNFMGAGYGAKINATTSDELIQHEMVFNVEDLAAVLPLHAESLLRASFNPHNIQWEKNNTINEVSRRYYGLYDQKQDSIHKMLFERSGHQTTGRPQDMQGTTVDQLRRFYQMAYAPNNLFTVISGNVSPQAVLSILGPELERNPLPPAPPDVQSAGLQLDLGPNEVRSDTITSPELNNSIVKLAFPAPAYRNYTERMATEFLASILFDSPASPLARNLVETGKAFGLRGEYTPLKQTGVFSIELNTSPGQEQVVLQEALNCIAALGIRRPSDQLVEATRKKLNREFDDQVSRVWSPLENTDVTSRMGENGIRGSLPYFLEYKRLASLMSADDIQRAAQAVLNPQRYVVTFVLPQKTAPFVAARSPQGGQQ